MKINLAKIVPAVFYVALAIAVLAIGTRNSGDGASSPPSYDPGPTSTRDADRYLDEVAIALASPGVYVDPDVIASGGLSTSEVRTLDKSAARQKGPVRIAVLPAERLMEDGTTYPSRYQLAYDQEDVVGQLYDRVGSDGTYAVLVDASSESDGRSFFAVQYAEEGPTYDIEGAANDCCAPDYADILESFVDDAGDEHISGGTWLLRIGGLLGALAALVFGHRLYRRWRERRDADEEIVDVLRFPLNEEVIELSARVSALPPADAGTEVSTQTVAVLDLVEQARQRLDTMSTAKDAEAVTSRLADARWRLVVIDALRAGKPAPGRTAPCFFDPRHGPSTAEHPFAPEGGDRRPVPVCEACRAELAADRRPEVRRISKSGRNELYWDLGPASRPYLDGYWQRDRHPEPRAERNRRAAVVAKRPGEGFTFVWEPSESDGDSGSGGSGSSGRSRSSSGRTRSFGGGRSSRSSSRSRGGGGF